MSKQFVLKKMEHLNCDYRHPSYYLERKLISEIKRGIEDLALDTLDAINSIERAILANNPVRSLKNSLIGSCTLFARAAVEANVHPEDVFSQSDLFILKIEQLNTMKDLQNFEYHMVRTYIRMINQERTHTYSLPVTEMINHIHSHITESITLHDLAQTTHKSKEYLSTVFKKEVGLNLIDYIQNQKIEESKHFLEFTNMNMNEISILFHFCNAGYYTRIFKKHVGKTPSQYRKEMNM